MLHKLYNQLWDFIDPFIYAFIAIGSLGLSIAIF